MMLGEFWRKCGLGMMGVVLTGEGERATDLGKRCYGGTM